MANGNNLFLRLIISAKDEASGILDALKSKAGLVASAITGYFGFSLFKSAISEAAAFERALSEVKAVSGASAAEMATLKTAVEQASQSYGRSVVDVTSVVTELTRSGMSARDAIAAMPPVLAMARAENMDLGQATGYVTQTLAGFNLAVGDAGRIADVLAKGSAEAKTSIRGLGEALSYAAPLAQSLGLSIEQTTAIIGKLADGGIDASRAGTGLMEILGQFADPASKFKTELRAAGITTHDFSDALHRVANSGSHLERIITAVGLNAGPALRTLLNKGMPALDELTGKLQASKGAAEGMARTMQDNLASSWDTLGVVWQNVKKALGEPILAFAKKEVDGFGDTLKAWVASGTATKFGESIRGAFESCVKWIKAFAAEFDFAHAGETLRTFAANCAEVFRDIGVWSRNAGDVVKTVGGVMSAGFNLPLSAIYKIAEAFSGVASNILHISGTINDGLAKITFGSLSAHFKAAATEMHGIANGVWAVSEGFAKKSEEAFAAATRGAEQANIGWGKLNAAAPATADAVKTTGDAAGKTAEKLDTAGAAAAGAAKAITQVAAAAGSVVPASQAAAQALGGVGTGASEAKAKAAELRAEFLALRNSGEATPAALKEAWDKYLAALSATVPAMKAIAAAAKEALERQKELGDAMVRVGIKTREDLATSAQQALRDYNLIRESGVATTAGITAAWKKYAEAAVEANGGVVSSAMEMEAKMRGFSIEADGAGHAIIKSMAEAARQTDRYGDSVDDATDQVRKLRDQQERPTRPEDDGSTVMRNTATSTVDHAAIAQTQGLSGEQAKKFVEVYGGMLQRSIDDMNKRRGTAEQNPEHYQHLYAEAAAAAVKEARDYVKAHVNGDATGLRTPASAQPERKPTNVSSTPAMPAPLAENKPAAQPTQPQPASYHRVEVVLNGHPTQIDTATQQSASDLIKLLQELQSRAH